MSVERRKADPDPLTFKRWKTDPQNENGYRAFRAAAEACLSEGIRLGDDVTILRGCRLEVGVERAGGDEAVGSALAGFHDSSHAKRARDVPLNATDPGHTLESQIQDACFRAPMTTSEIAKAVGRPARVVARVLKFMAGEREPKVIRRLDKSRRTKWWQATVESVRNRPDSPARRRELAEAAARAAAYVGDRAPDSFLHLELSPAQFATLRDRVFSPDARFHLFEYCNKIEKPYLETLQAAGECRDYNSRAVLWLSRAELMLEDSVRTIEVVTEAYLAGEAVLQVQLFASDTSTWEEFALRLPELTKEIADTVKATLESCPAGSESERHEYVFALARGRRPIRPSHTKEAFHVARRNP